MDWLPGPFPQGTGTSGHETLCLRLTTEDLPAIPLYLANSARLGRPHAGFSLPRSTVNKI